MIWLRNMNILALAILMSTLSAYGGDGQAPGTYMSDYIAQINAVESQIVSLEGAVPQEKFTWRPAEGVRSISEVYLHIAGGNYLLISFAGQGFEPPKEANYSGNTKWETATTNKDEIANTLKASFDHLHAKVSTIHESDFDRTVNFFGSEISLRSLLMNCLNHLHEHLGQSIAYARMNGVVPPWTAAREAAAKEKK